MGSRGPKHTLLPLEVQRACWVAPGSAREGGGSQLGFSAAKHFIEGLDQLE